MATAGIFSLGQVYKQQGTGSWSDSRLYGYAYGDLNGITTVERVDFSNDTARANTRGSLVAAHYGNNCASSSLTAAYAHSSEAGATLNRNTFIERIEYSNDSANAAVRAYHAQQTGFLTMIYNTQYAYSAGGYSWAASSIRSEITRFNYSNDTANSSIINNLAAARYGMQKHFNDDYGWYVGGNQPGSPYRTDIFRFDFSNDTSPLSQRGFRSIATYTGDGTGTKDYGWFCGGKVPAAPNDISVIDRLDLQNDLGTLSVRGPLSTPRQGHQCLNSSGYGYVVNGTTESGPKITTIERLDFTNDTSTTSNRGNISVGKSRAAATSGLLGGGTSQNLLAVATPSVAEYGYVINSATDEASPSNRTSIERIDYQNDLATTSIRSYTQLSGAGGRAVSNSAYAWWAGGNFPANDTRVQRLDYQNDTTNGSIRGDLVQGRRSFSASENDTYGWYLAGINDGIPSALSSIDRLTFASDLGTMSSRGTLTAVRGRHGGFGNLNYSYVGGGLNPSPASTTVERFDYGSDLSTASYRSDLPANQWLQGGISDSANYGLFIGGDQRTVYRLNFSSDQSTVETRASLAVSSHGTRGQDGLYSSSVGAGYLTACQKYPAPGATPNDYVSSTLRIDFSTSDLSPILRGNLPYTAGGVCNASSRGLIHRKNLTPITLPKTGTYGWYAGGGTLARSVIDRIDYGNDLSIARTTGQLSVARYETIGTGNVNSGWFAGGYGGGTRSIIDRLDYGNDLTVASTRGPLNIAVYDVSAVSNNNYGWFGGGEGPVATSSIQRVDFINDQTTAVQRTTFASNRRGIGAAGNLNYGWFVGGEIPAPSLVTLVSRIDYSSDTSPISTRGNINTTQMYFGSTGNLNYGWFAGGLSPAVISSVERIDYGNDLATASVRGPLNQIKMLPNATSNNNYGWFSGGKSGLTFYSIVDRIDFANDTPAASSRGPLSGSVYGMAAAGNMSIG